MSTTSAPYGGIYGAMKEILRSQCLYLKDRLNVTRTTLLDRLVDAKVIRKREKEEIVAKDTPTKQAGELVDILESKDGEDLEKFLRQTAEPVKPQKRHKAK